MTTGQIVYGMQDDIDHRGRFRHRDNWPHVFCALRLFWRQKGIKAVLRRAQHLVAMYVEEDCIGRENDEVGGKRA